LWKSYDEAALRLLDSRLLAHLARLCSADPPPVVTGADLLAGVLPAFAARGARVAVVGLEPEVMDALRARFSGVIFVHCNPAPGFEHDTARFGAVRDFVIGARADCTIFAVGSPRQELLAHSVWRVGGAVGIGLCVGAAPLFLSGTLRRAPGWMRRRAGLEWAWRLAREPRRLARRNLVDGPPVLVLILRDLLVGRALPSHGNCAIDESRIKGMEALCSGRPTHDLVPLDPRSARRGIPDQS